MAEKIVVYVEPDHDAEDPCDCDGWKVHSFSLRHSNYKHPSDFDHEELMPLLEKGLAFKLSYFEHGQCEWSLSGEGYQCEWDSVSFAGLLVWEQDEGDLGPKTLEARKKDAAAFLETYTKWCNGECYYYRAVKVRDCPTCGKEEEIEDDYVDSCGGFIGGEALHEGIGESLGEGPFEIRGECACVLEDAPCAK